MIRTNRAFDPHSIRLLIFDLGWCAFLRQCWPAAAATAIMAAAVTASQLGLTMSGVDQPALRLATSTLTGACVFSATLWSIGRAVRRDIFEIVRWVLGGHRAARTRT